MHNFIFEVPGLGDKNRFLFLLKSLTVFFFGARIFGFFGSEGCSFGDGSFFSSDMAGSFCLFKNGAKLEKDGYFVYVLDTEHFSER